MEIKVTEKVEVTKDCYEECDKCKSRIGRYFEITRV